MKKILGLYLVSNPDMKKFYIDMVDTVKDLENDELEIEIQYSTNEGSYSALIIGRKEI